MNVLDRIRENIRLHDLRKQKRKVVEESMDKQNSLPSDNAVFPCVHFLQSACFRSARTANALSQLVNNAVKVADAGT